VNLSADQPTTPKPEARSPRRCWLDGWHVNPSVNRDYDFIDGLRGVAILMVVFGHHLYVNPKSGPLIQFLGSVIGVGAGGGLVLFFALSGFLISWPFWKRKFTENERVVPPGYAKRRFWKIYPPLAISVILLTPAYVLVNHDAPYISIAAKWLAGIPFVFPISGKFNPVMWSLVIEVQFYVVLPLVFLALKNVSAKICLWILPLIFVLVPVIFRAFTGQWANFTPDINSHFPSALDAFCLGILVAGLDNHGALRGRWARLGTAGVVLWPLALLFEAWARTHLQLQGSKPDTALPWCEKVASGLMLCYVADPQNALARLLCWPALRWCGIISYEWYLFHQPIFIWARNFLGPAGGNVAVYASIVGGSILAGGIFSALIYRYFSLPILKYGRSYNRN
jgi:peptidoglycan/LPS O-acetylase OafA/YrhL